MSITIIAKLCKTNGLKLSESNETDSNQCRKGIHGIVRKLCNRRAFLLFRSSLYRPRPVRVSHIFPHLPGQKILHMTKRDHQHMSFGHGIPVPTGIAEPVLCNDNVSGRGTEGTGSCIHALFHSSPASFIPHKSA